MKHIGVPSVGTDTTAVAAPHKDFSDLYEKMSDKGARASQAHLGGWLAAASQQTGPLASQERSAPMPRSQHTHTLTHTHTHRERERERERERSFPARTNGPLLGSEREPQFSIAATSRSLRIASEEYRGRCN